MIELLMPFQVHDGYHYYLNHLQQYHDVCHFFHLQKLVDPQLTLHSLHYPL